jgi:molybdate transport system ATP-binding protein
MLVKLDANGATLLARITRKSAAALELSAGKAVYAQIKTVALLSA